MVIRSYSFSYRARYSSFYEQRNERQLLSSLTQTGQHKAFIVELTLLKKIVMGNVKPAVATWETHCNSTPE
jgi:hypothetical protein